MKEALEGEDRQRWPPVRFEDEEVPPLQPGLEAKPPPRFHFLGLTLFLPLLAACSTLLQAPSTVEVSLRFPQEVQAGGVAEGTLRVRAAEYTGEAILEVLSPEGFTLLSPNRISVQTGEREYPVRIAVASSVAPGEHEVVLRVRPRGLDPLTARATLRVVPETPPFVNLSLSPGSLVLAREQRAQVTLTLTPEGNFRGAVAVTVQAPDFLEVSPPTAGVNLTGEAASVTFTVRPLSEGSGTVTFRAESGAMSQALPLPVTVQGFSGRLDPQNLTVYQGQSESLTLHITPREGLSGLVALSLLEGSAPVTWASLNPNYVSLAPSGEQAFPITLSVTRDAPLGTRILTLRMVHPAGQVDVPLSLAVRAPSFQASLSPTSFTLRPGENALAILTLTLEGGFTGSIALSLTGASGFDVFPGTIDTSAARWGLQIRNVSATAPGVYDLELRLASGSLTRTVPITVVVPPPPDFTLTVSPTSFTVPPGSSGTFQVSVAPQGGFSGTVNLSLVDDATSSPIPGLSLTPTSLTVSGADPQTFSVTLSVGASVPSGTYYLRLVGTSGSLTRASLIRLTVP